jgi:hypothetical protein
MKKKNNHNAPQSYIITLFYVPLSMEEKRCLLIFKDPQLGEF